MNISSLTKCAIAVAMLSGTVFAGGFRTGSTTCTPCGGSNPCGLLPDLPALVTVSAWHNPGPNGSVPSYFDLLLAGGTILDGLQDAWCVDTHDNIGGVPFDVIPVCSYDSADNKVVDHPENLPQVNWLLNQVMDGLIIGGTADCGGAFTYGDVQRAIWSLISDTQSTSGLGDWEQCHVDELVAMATLFGTCYTPGCGDYLGVLLVPVEARQVTIIMVKITCQPHDCKTYGSKKDWRSGCAAWTNKSCWGHWSFRCLGHP